MKRIIYILFAFTLIFSSCTELGLQTLFEDDCIVMTVSSSTMTKADDKGTAYERQLNTVHFFFYPKGQTDSPCVFYHKVDFKGSTTGKEQVKIFVVEDAIGKIFPTDNTCEVFAIANLPEYLTPAVDSDIFKDDSEYTTLDKLQKYILKLDDETNPDYVPSHDGVNKPFVMAGLGTAQKDSKKNAVGSINLRRAAAKVTISVAIPEYIDNVPVTEDGKLKYVRMVPFPFEENPSLETINTAFHNGNYKGYLYSDVDDAIDSCYIASSKKQFKFSHYLDPIKYKNPEMENQDSIPTRRVYTCEVPFYTYAREWEKGAADAAYMTFEMRWGAKQNTNIEPVYQKYFYQILINGGGRSFESNCWYDMFVNVGVIGSSVELTPIIFDDIMFFVLDWSDETSGVAHPDEEIVLENFTYLHVDTPVLVLDNQSIAHIKYKASHEIDYSLNTTSKKVEGMDNLSTTEGAFYIDCTTSTPQVKPISGYKLTKKDGILQYDYTIPNTIYSPVYVYLTLWIELDGMDGMSNEEEKFSESVMIVQYPPMYVTPDTSTEYSIFVNGRHRYGTDITYKNGNTTYNLGKSSGDSNRGDQMYVISVSSFNADDTFQWRAKASDNYVDKSYIIGDPRTREPMDFTKYNMTNNWVNDKIKYNSNLDTYNNVNNVEKGTGRKLQHYYPTSTEGESYRVIAPKFRMSSFFGGYSSSCTVDGAVLRCASYQEDGYPAGRWRVPTTAEVQFVIMLQENDVIVPIFYDGNYYYSASQQVSSSGDVRANSDDNNTSSSVRCVYDEWYWGSEKEAVANSNYAGGYEFTWGDEQITW